MKDKKVVSQFEYAINEFIENDQGCPGKYTDHMRPITLSEENELREKKIRDFCARIKTKNQ